MAVVCFDGFLMTGSVSLEVFGRGTAAGTLVFSALLGFVASCEGRCGRAVFVGSSFFDGAATGGALPAFGCALRSLLRVLLVVSVPVVRVTFGVCCSEPSVSDAATRLLLTRFAVVAAPRRSCLLLGGVTRRVATSTRLVALLFHA